MSLRLPVGFFNVHFECAPTPTLEKKIYLKFAKKRFRLLFLTVNVQH